jgi:GNAT superfamily N-acetyltransferase
MPDGCQTIVAVRPDRAAHAFDTLTQAFVDDPPTRWLFPDADLYWRFFPVFAEMFGGAAVAARTAIEVEDAAGVALWLAPGGAGPDEAGLVRLVEDCTEPQRHAGVLAVFEEMGRRHPTEPHWYLPLIGVRPRRQGRGIGAALLAAGLRVCDIERLPAYLESTNPRNQPLYERHGFVPLDPIVVADCPPIVPMLRPPR